MSRPRKVIKDPAKRKAHEAQLAKRRRKHAIVRAQEAAVEAARSGAESEADFEKLVAVEKERMQKQQSKAASKSPKAITAARENLTLAFDLMGGVPALVAWGRQNPTEFYRLWARLIPKESVEVSAQLPLEALLSKLQTREQMSVGEAAYQVGQDLMNDARIKVIEHDAQNPDFENPYEDHDEETIQ